MTKPRFAPSVNIELAADANLSPVERADRANAALGFRFVRALAVEKAVLDPRLSGAAVKVLAAISYFMDSSSQRAWPSWATIQEVAGISERTMTEALQSLKAHGYVFTERRAPIGGGRAIVHYALGEVRIGDLDAVVTAAVTAYRDALPAPRAVRPKAIRKPSPSNPLLGQTGLTLQSIARSDASPSNQLLGQNAASPSNPLLGEGLTTQNPARSEGADLANLRIQEPLVKEEKRSEEVVSRTVSTSTPRASLFGMDGTDEPAPVRYDGRKIVAELRASGGAAIARHVVGRDIRSFATRMGIPAAEAVEALIAELERWQARGYCGSHAGWLGQLLDDAARNHRAIDTATAAPVETRGGIARPANDGMHLLDAEWIV